MTYRSFLHHSVEHDNAPAFLLPHHLPKVTARVRQGALQIHNPQSVYHFTHRHAPMRAHSWWLADDSALRQSGDWGWDRDRPPCLVVSNLNSIFCHVVKGYFCLSGLVQG